MRKALVVSDLYRRYEAQPDKGKLLVELLAFYDSKITKGPLTTAYNELTRKARLGRINVKQLLSVLEDQGLVRLTFHGFYSCAPSIVEDVAASAKTRRSAKAVVRVCHHRRIRFDDLMAYKAADDAKREIARRELTELAQDTDIDY